MSHLTGTGERNADYIEREAEHTTREARAERRERHEFGYRRTPELDSIRGQLETIRNREAGIVDWKRRVLSLLAPARDGQCEVPLVAVKLHEIYGLLVEREREIEAAHNGLLVELNKEREAA